MSLPPLGLNSKSAAGKPGGTAPPPTKIGSDPIRLTQNYDAGGVSWH
jgi:hypothetical protein